MSIIKNKANVTIKMFPISRTTLLSLYRINKFTQYPNWQYLTYLLIDLWQLDGPTQHGAKVVWTRKVVNFVLALEERVLGRAHKQDMSRSQRQHFRKILLGLWWYGGLKRILVRSHFLHYYFLRHYSDLVPCLHYCCYCYFWSCFRRVSKEAGIYWREGSHLMILCVRMVGCVLCGHKLDFNYFDLDPMITLI